MNRKRLYGNTAVDTYTINSNSEGAIVLFDNVEMGTIKNGICTVELSNGKDSYSVTLRGGSLPSTKIDYTLSVSPTTLSFTSSGGTKSITVTSSYDQTSYSNTSGTVNKNDSVTLNYTSSVQTGVSIGYTTSASGTGFSVNGTSVSASSNESSTGTTSSRTGLVTVTQNDSNKTATVSLSQAGRNMYSYTVNSNCNGGTVSFNGVNKGTISGSKLVFYDTASSGTVSISGGVPSSSTSQTSTQSDTDTESQSVTQNDCTVSKTSFSFGYSGGSDTASINSSYRTGTQYRSRSMSRPVYTTYNYSAPSNKTCNGNSSVTMNYTSSTSTSYGSWSYGSWGSWGSTSWGSWQYKTPTVTAQSTWAPGSISGSSEPWTLTVNCSSTTSSRSDYFTVNMANGVTQRINLSQSAPSSSDYQFYFCNGNNVNNNLGTTLEENTFFSPVANASFGEVNNGYSGYNLNSKLGSATSGTQISGTASASGTNNSVLSIYNSGISNYWSMPDTGTSSSRCVMYKWSSNNTGYYGRGPVSVTITQAGSGKKLTITNIIQLAVEFNCGYTANYKSSYDVPEIAATGGKFRWRGCYKWHYPSPESSYSGLGYTMPPGGTWKITSKPSWLTPDKTSGDMSDNNTDVWFTASANTSTSSRSGTLVLTESLLGKTATFNVTQAGASAVENYFYITTSRDGIFCVTNNNSQWTPPSSTTEKISFPAPCTKTKVTQYYTSNTALSALPNANIYTVTIWFKTGTTWSKVVTGRSVSRGATLTF